VSQLESFHVCPKKIDKSDECTIFYTVSYGSNESNFQTARWLKVLLSVVPEKDYDCPWDCSRSLLSHKQSCVCVSLSMMPVLNEVLPVNRSVTEFDFAFLNVVEFWQFRQFPHSNPTDVQRLFLVEFKFAFELRNSKLFWLPRLQINTKWKAINISTPTASKTRMWHLHCAIRCYWLLATDWYIKSLLKLENSLLNTEIVKFTFSF